MQTIGLGTVPNDPSSPFIDDFVIVLWSLFSFPKKLTYTHSFRFLYSLELLFFYFKDIKRGVSKRQIGNQRIAR